MTEEQRKRLAAWEAHRAACEECRRAVRMRFAGATTGQIARRTCPAGRPLFDAFVRAIDANPPEAVP